MDIKEEIDMTEQEKKTFELGYRLGVKRSQNVKEILEEEIKESGYVIDMETAYALFIMGRKASEKEQSDEHMEKSFNKILGNYGSAVKLFDDKQVYYDGTPPSYIKGKVPEFLRVEEEREDIIDSYRRTFEQGYLFQTPEDTKLEIDQILKKVGADKYSEISLIDIISKSAQMGFSSADIKRLHYDQIKYEEERKREEQGPPEIDIPEFVRGGSSQRNTKSNNRPYTTNTPRDPVDIPDIGRREPYPHTYREDPASYSAPRYENVPHRPQFNQMPNNMQYQSRYNAKPRQQKKQPAERGKRGLKAIAWVGAIITAFGFIYNHITNKQDQPLLMEGSNPTHDNQKSPEAFRESVSVNGYTITYNPNQQQKDTRMSNILAYFDLLKYEDPEVSQELIQKYANGYDYGTATIEDAMKNQSPLSDIEYYCTKDPSIQTVGNKREISKKSSITFANGSFQIVADATRDIVAIKMLQALGEPIGNYEQVKINPSYTRDGKTDVVMEYNGTRYARRFNTLGNKPNGNGEIPDSMAVSIGHIGILERKVKNINDQKLVSTMDGSDEILVIDAMKNLLGFVDKDFEIQNGKIVDLQAQMER
jgi:hypothetical protein